MKVKLTFTEELLGTACPDPEVHKKYIASKSKDAEKMQEELEALDTEAAMQNAITVFARGPDGKPMLFDYQCKGFLKEATGILLEIMDKEIRVGKTKLSKFTHKRIVDNYIMVYPRGIKLNGDMGEICTRPLRADTPKGERVSLVSSETMQKGTTLECEIKTLTPALDELVVKCLDYGAMKGMGQWRNSGRGRFTWQEVN